MVETDVKTNTVPGIASGEELLAQGAADLPDSSGMDADSWEKADSELSIAASNNLSMESISRFV